MAAESPKILEELRRYRRLHAEAVRLLQDIIVELEAGLSSLQHEAGKKAGDG
jgi:hypothetical protein